MIVEIPNVGDVEFPDTMSAEQVLQTIKQKFVKLPTGGMAPVLPGTDNREKPIRPLFDVQQGNPTKMGLGQLLTTSPVRMNRPENLDTGVTGTLEGVGLGLGNLATAAVTPAYAALPAVGKIPAVGPSLLSALGIKFGSDILQQTGRDLGQGVTGPKLGEAAVNIPAALLMAGHGAAGLRDAVIPPERPVPLSAFSPLKPDDIHTVLTGQEVVPPERQLRNTPIVLPQQVEGPIAPSAVPKGDKPLELLPPGSATETAAGRNPTATVSGGTAPVALSFQELGKKTNRTPEEEARFQELKAKSDKANKDMAAAFAAKLVPEAKAVPAVRYGDRVYTGQGHLGAVTKLQADLARAGITDPKQIDETVGKAEHGWQQPDGSFTTEEKPNASSKSSTTRVSSSKQGTGVDEKTPLQQQGSVTQTQNEKEKTQQTRGVLPTEKGLQSQGSGGTRSGGGGSPGTEQKAPTVQAPNEGAGKTPSIGGGIAKAVEKNKNDESGMVDLRGVVDAVVQARKKLAASLATRDNKKDIVREKDVADNAAVIVGQRARTGQESLAKALFGPRSKDALNATTAAIEAKGDVKKLDDFIRIARAKNDQSGLNAATFAKNNWSKIQPLVKRAEAQHNMVFNAAKAEGVNVDYRTGYIRHLYDLSKLPQHYADLFFGESGGSGGKGFKKERTFDTLYDAINAGYGKAIKSWNSAELLEHRLRRGFQEVNDLQWAKHFATVKDPTTGSPVVSLTERPGYERWSPLGQTFYIHRGYGKVFEAAQGMSAIRKFEIGGLPIGDAFMKGLGTAKHSLLMFDSYHAIRMAAKSLSLTGGVGHRAGLALLEYNPGDLRAAVQSGDITQGMADWANKNRATANLGIKNGLNIGRVQEAIDSDIVRKLNVLGTGTANKWIFEKFTRGVMLETFVNEFDRVKKANPTMTDDSVAKKVARDLNFNFGNIGRQGILRSATAQDMARMVFLAPQWFESMAQTEARSVGQIAKVPVTGKVGTLAKGTGTLLLAMFVATQVANMASKGHPTWDNPEGHKMDAWIPGTGKTKEGLYVSPFSLPMELTHDVIRYTKQGKSPLAVTDQIVGNKLSPPMRASHTLFERKDYAGRPLTDKQTLVQAGKDALPLPLLGQAYLSPSSSFERQALASAGLKAEPAQSPRQRIAQLARVQSGDRTVYPVSKYAPLRTLLKNNKVEEAKAEYAKLVKGKTEKEVANVEQYFRELPDTIHTGSKEKEQAFYDGLSDEDKKLYEEVRKENKDLSEKFFNEVLGHGPKMTRTRKKRFSAFTYENE